VHVFSQPIHIGAGQSERQLQELLGKLEGPNACVQPGPWRGEKGSLKKHSLISARELFAPFHMPSAISYFRF
jgi:hypothetical protein